MWDEMDMEGPDKWKPISWKMEANGKRHEIWKYSGWNGRQHSRHKIWKLWMEVSATITVLKEKWQAFCKRGTILDLHRAHHQLSPIYGATGKWNWTQATYF